jgi:hypothetical protein
MKAQFVLRMPIHPKRVKEGYPPFYEPGHVLDHPQAFRLVQQGVAIPADAECEKRLGEAFMKNLQAILIAGERNERAIASEDFEAYNRGLMIGYKPDGKQGDTWIHGPHWHDGCEADYYDSQEDEDDDE